jgi:hypothetical protein
MPICGMPRAASTQPDLLNPDLEGRPARPAARPSKPPGQKRPTANGTPIPSPLADDQSAAAVPTRGAGSQPVIVVA